MGVRLKPVALSPREQLSFFVDRVEDLRQTRYLRSRFSATSTLQWSRERGMSCSWREPDREVLDAYLMRFRPFTMEYEPIYLPSVHVTAVATLESEYLRRRLSDAVLDWHQSFRKGSFKLVRNGVDDTPESAFRLWAYGCNFHYNTGNRAVLASMSPPEMMYSRQAYFDFLDTSTAMIFYARDVIVGGFREGHFKF